MMHQFLRIKASGTDERRTAHMGYDLARYEAMKATTQIRIGGMR